MSDDFSDKTIRQDTNSSKEIISPPKSAAVSAEEVPDCNIRNSASGKSLWVEHLQQCM